MYIQYVSVCVSVCLKLCELYMWRLTEKFRVSLRVRWSLLHSL